MQIFINFTHIFTAVEDKQISLKQQRKGIQWRRCHKRDPIPHCDVKCPQFHARENNYRKIPENKIP
jgi:hypothetical protein